jgi:hypothetical protein
MERDRGENTERVKEKRSYILCLLLQFCCSGNHISLKVNIFLFPLV